MEKSLIRELEEIKKTIAEQKQITEQGGVIIVKAIQHIVERIEEVNGTGRRKMKVLIVQPKSMMIEINPKELRSYVVEQLKDGAVLSLTVGVMYEVAEFDEVKIKGVKEENGHR